MERFIERFRYKATKARQAQSRVKKLDKMERIERDPRDNRSLGFSFGGAERTGRVVLELEGGRLEVPGRTLLEDGELWLERGEHVSLVGPNGAGKTTLIDALAGRARARRRQAPHRPQRPARLPLAARGGARARRGTVLEAAQRATGLTPNKARALLGRFLFSGEEAEKPLDGLSRRRAAAAVARDPGRFGRERADPRRADEPPRHRRREALEDALQRVRRARVLLVSHDRALLDAVGHAHVRDRGRHAAQLPGRLGRVLARARGAQGAEASAKRAPQAEGAKAKAAQGRRTRRSPPGPSKNAIKRAAELEREVEKAEAALRALEDELADPSAWASPTSSERATKRHAAAKKAVEAAYARWEAASPQ